MLVNIKPLAFWLLFASSLFLTNLGQAQTQKKPWLGIEISKNPLGIMIDSVVEEAPAFKYGLLPGDVIYAVSKKKVSTPKELIIAIGSKKIGSSIQVDFYRDAKPMSKNLKLELKPSLLDMVKDKWLNKKLDLSGIKAFGGPASSKNKATQLSDLPDQAWKGKPIVLKIWATWCPACLSTHDRLNQFKAKNHEKIAVVALSDEDSATLLNFSKKTDPTFYIAAGKKALELRSNLGFPALPAWVLADKNGVVQHVEMGAGDVTEKVLAKAIQLSKETKNK